MTEVERLQPGDVPGVLELINLVQPHVTWDEPFLRWQYFLPAAGAARVYVIRDGAVIVASYAAVPLRVDVRGVTHPGFIVQDVMTHPAYRGQGFLRRMAERSLADGVREVGLYFPNKSSESTFRKLGCAEVGLIPRRRLDLVEGRRTVEQGFLEPRQRPFDAANTALWEAAGLSGVRRDAAFLEWRYAKPGSAYTRHDVRGSAGFVVLKTFDDGERRVVHVCDLVLHRSAQDLLPGLLGDIVTHARALGAAAVTAWLGARHPYAPAFDAAGLLLEEHDRYMLVTGPPELGLTDMIWHVTQGDSDVY